MPAVGRVSSARPTRKMSPADEKVSGAEAQKTGTPSSSARSTSAPDAATGSTLSPEWEGR